MIIRLILAIILVVVAYKLYQRIFTQKTCVACAKKIGKQAAVCHHCNTLQS
ncbi:MAG: hypothetical protein R8M46_07995 [Ghiorsea sp.]